MRNHRGTVGNRVFYGGPCRGVTRRATGARICMKFQHHNFPIITLLRQMVMCSTLLCTRNIRLSEVTVSDILDSDHQPIALHLLEHITIKNLSDPVDKFRYCERFQSLASEIISLRIQIISEEEARDFPALIASAYRLSTSKITLSDLNKNPPGLESLLKRKRRSRKLW
jgi:hypothetical protein